MTVAPLIAMKSTKCESLEAVGKELDRRAHTYANDIDGSGRHIGYRCRAEDERPVPLDKAVERRMGELNTKRKIRDNAVRAMGFIVSSNDALDEKSAREFLDRSINWFGARYGYENLLAAQIHLDEGTPHAHIWVAPVIHDRETGFDRLCAKELFAPDKRRKNAEGKWEVVAQGTMSRLQEDFWEQVSKPYGYERPLRHELRAKGYRSLDAYKVQVGTTRALKSEIETLEGARDKAKHGAITAKRELDGLEQLRVESDVKLGAVTAKVDEKRAQAAEIDRRIAEKMAELDRLDGEIGEKIDLRNEVGDNLQREQRRLESVRQAAGRLEEDVEKLEAIASLADKFDHAGRFEKRGILDEIAARCDGLRGRVEQVVEGIRGAVGRLEVAIADLARKLAPRSARMTTRALKRDLAALEEDMSPVTLASEAREAARASNARRGNVPQRDRGQSR
ncbi:MobV family relaxase [Collinsella aerofaciens]|uniref:MobV family relaxase n=1 Tax=Collinsella aerofaciens TaxID=74426 RepID=UPI00232FF7D0|nr:MobV family relaxase [Collinsella aerofaciens]MDB1917015.1 plasmid recombination protein [Collinsella aerofaciens]